MLTVPRWVFANYLPSVNSSSKAERVTKLNAAIKTDLSLIALNLSNNFIKSVLINIIAYSLFLTTSCDRK